MTTDIKTFFVGVAAAYLGAALATGALAGGLHPLSDRQMDRVTAGGVFVYSDVYGDATAQYRTSATALSNTIAGTNLGVQQGFQSEGALATGTVVTFGTNGADSSAPPPQTNSSVATGGTADGNYTVMIAGGGSSSALGLTIRGSFTSVYGAFVPGL